MRGEILRAEVRLCLDDAAHATYARILMHEMHADELASDDECAARIEIAWQPGERFSQSVARIHRQRHPGYERITPGLSTESTSCTSFAPFGSQPRAQALRCCSRLRAPHLQAPLRMSSPRERLWCSA